MSSDGGPILEDLGWGPFFESGFEPHRCGGLLPGRVAVRHRDAYVLFMEDGEAEAAVSGRMRFEAVSAGDFPATGDWVAASPPGAGGRAVIHALLPRRSCFSRKSAGLKTEEQVLAANADVAFLVSALDEGRGFSPRRIERLAALAHESGANPVFVLNKADLCEDCESAAAAAESAAAGAPVHAVSATGGIGVDSLLGHLSKGRTCVFLGPSGVGKSTLVNAILGFRRQEVREVRADDMRGRHTTTRRELIPVPSGGLIIDTPGIREVQLWADDDAPPGGFEDIDGFARMCRFRDCRHESEPGCAVQKALGEGGLDQARFESFMRLNAELRFLENRKGYLEAKRERFRKISKWCKKTRKEEREERT